MKKLVGALALAVLLSSCTQVKIAHVDVEEILKEYKGSKKAEEEMKAESDKMAAELDQLAIPFQQKVQDYQQNSQSMSTADRQAKEQELMREEQMIRQRQQLAQQQVQAEGQKMIDKINEDIEEFLEGYAKSKGYTYILGTSATTRSVMYGDESLDITDEVLEALNDGYDDDDSASSSESETAEEPAPVN